MKLFFRRLGEGPPLIILHGLLGASDNWLSIARELAGSHTIFLPDLRNHGRSPHSREFSYEAMAMDVNEFMLDHGLRDVILAGHSMGGKVAMNLALDYPHKIKKLIVADIAPKPYPLPYFANIIRTLMSADLGGVKNRAEAERMISGEIPEKGVRSFLLKNLARDRRGGFTWKVNLPALYENAEKIAGEIERPGTYPHPALFLRGENSNYITGADFPLIKAKFPRAQILAVPGAGHWIHADAPEQVLEMFREFIGRET